MRRQSRRCERSSTAAPIATAARNGSGDLTRISTGKKAGLPCRLIWPRKNDGSPVSAKRGQLGDAAGKRRDPVERVGRCSRKPPRPLPEKPRARPATLGQDANSRSGCQYRPVAPAIDRAAPRRTPPEGKAGRTTWCTPRAQPRRRAAARALRRRAQATARTRKRRPAKVAANGASVVASPECARKTGRLPSAITARAPSTGPT